MKLAVDAYSRLFCHRTVILEGIRKVACRNMVHFEQSLRQCESKHRHLTDAEKLDCVYRIILKDQGLTPNELILQCMGWATFHPAQVYLALLYAEIEHYRTTCASIPVLADDYFSAYLDDKSQWIAALEKFRNVFLHPQPNRRATELNFLNSLYSYHQGPLLQVELNSYLKKVQAKLRKDVLKLCETLPENNKILCFHKYTAFNKLRMELYEDDDGVRGAKVRLDDLYQRMDNGEIPDWKPNKNQLEEINTLADCLDAVSPSGPELTAAMDATVTPDHADIVQTPISIGLLGEVLRGRGRPSYGNSRHASYVTAHKAQYRIMVFASYVLLYEIPARMAMEYLPEKYTSEQLDRQIQQLIKQTAKRPFEDGKPVILHGSGMQTAAELVSLTIVGSALLYEPLRMYAKLIEEDFSIADRRLDEWVEPDKLDRFRIYRNAIFHTACNPDELRSLARIILNFSSQSYGNLHSGLADFFGFA